nr:unnamed protein product [Spirometra erinaceieuropaei]
MLNRIIGRRRLLVCGRLLRPFVGSFSCVSSPPSSPITLGDHNINHMFGAYEEVLSIQIHYLRQGLGANNILLFPGPFGSIRTDYMDFLQRLNINENCMFMLNRIIGRRGLLVCGRLLRPFVGSFSNVASPPSSPINLRDDNSNHIFGAYEEVLSMQIHYLRHGRGADNILLFPGPFGSIRTDYMDFLRRLNINEFTAIAFDPPGCGFSTPPTRDWSDPEVLLQDARVGVNLMRQLGHLPFSCIGWSEGALSAIRAASELNMDGQSHFEWLTLLVAHLLICSRMRILWTLSNGQLPGLMI